MKAKTHANGVANNLRRTQKRKFELEENLNIIETTSTKTAKSRQVEFLISLQGTGITLRKLKSKYRCVANPTKKPHKIKMYNFRTKKYELSEFYGMGISGCCQCRMFNDYEKLYLIGESVMHESCAMKFFNASASSK